MSFWTARPSTLNILARHTWRGSEEPVRVYVDGDTATVWGVEGRKVVRRYDAAIATLEMTNGVWQLTTTEGEVWSLDRGGCGCGSPLKGFDPSKVTEVSA